MLKFNNNGISICNSLLKLSNWKCNWYNCLMNWHNINKLVSILLMIKLSEITYTSTLSIEIWILITFTFLSCLIKKKLCISTLNASKKFIFNHIVHFLFHTSLAFLIALFTFWCFSIIIAFQTGACILNSWFSYAISASVTRSTFAKFKTSFAMRTAFTAYRLIRNFIVALKANAFFALYLTEFILIAF